MTLPPDPLPGDGRYQLRSWSGNVPVDETFTVAGDAVTVSSIRPDWPTTTRTMALDDARRHWRHLRLGGWVPWQPAPFEGSEW